jgi:hypothetical protein
MFMAEDAQQDVQIAGLAQRWHCRAAIAGATSAPTNPFSKSCLLYGFRWVSSRLSSKICE